MLGCVAISWKSPLVLQGTACLLSAEKNTVQKRWLPKGRTGPVPKRKKLVQRVLARCTGAGAGPTAADSSGKESWSAGSWEHSQWILPRGPTADPPQPNPTLGLQIALTTDGYTCLLSVWSLVTVLVKSQKMLPSASKHYYCFIWIKPRVSDFHADTGGHSGFTLE